MCGSSKRAWPRTTVHPFIPSSHDSTSWRSLSMMPSLRALTLAMSTVTGPVPTPYSAPRLARWAACALATRVLVGIHPVLTQVPPISLRSTTATVWPASVNRPASGGPACPAPTTIASNRRVIRCSSDIRWESRPRPRRHLRGAQSADRGPPSRQPAACGPHNRPRCPVTGSRREFGPCLT